MVDDEPCEGGAHCCCCGPGEACCDCGRIMPDQAALDELKRRYPQGDSGYPCPDCGSLDHFECDR